MAYKDLGNNIWFDAETGQMKIADAAGKSQWEYDPRHGDKGGTLLGDQWFAGNLDPRVLGGMTDQGLQDAYGKYTDPNFDMTTLLPDASAYVKAHPNMPINQNTFDYQRAADMNSFQDAYATQAKAMGDYGDPFTTAIQNMAKNQGIMSSQETKNTMIQDQIAKGQSSAADYKLANPGVSDDVAQVMSNSNMTDAVKQAILGSNYPGQKTPTPVQSPYATGSGQTFDYNLGRYKTDGLPKSAKEVGYVSDAQMGVTSSATTPKAVATPDVMQTEQQPGTSAEQPSTTPDYTGFLDTLYSQIQPYITSLSTPASSTSSFKIGSSREPSISTNNATPDFKSGGYQTQSKYSSPSGSGKGASTSQPSSNQGMATGQFGSK